VAYLFDTDAISEVLKKRPAPAYLRWLKTIPRDEQFTSAVAIGELYKGAFRASDRDRHLHNVEKRVLPSLTVLPYEVATARVYGAIRADLERRGRSLADADLQIAATALQHGLELVTGNTKHFRRVPGLTLAAALTSARLDGPGATERTQSSDRVRGRRPR
jgi:predicted nucleic acid-binding protein